MSLTVIPLRLLRARMPSRGKSYHCHLQSLNRRRVHSIIDWCGCDATLWHNAGWSEIDALVVSKAYRYTYVRTTHNWVGDNQASNSSHSDHYIHVSFPHLDKSTTTAWRRTESCSVLLRMSVQWRLFTRTKTTIKATRNQQSPANTETLVYLVNIQLRTTIFLLNTNAAK